MITVYSSFEEILGKKGDQYTAQERRERWEQWKECARKKKDGQQTIDYWSDISTCDGCMHLEKKNAWCKAMELPCTVNPILSFSTGMIGMACMGLGYEADAQLKLFPA